MANSSSAGLSFASRVSVPNDTLFRELDGESVILNLTSERYFGLDAVGTRMWNVLTTSDSIQAGYEALLAEYDVDPDKLRLDIQELLEKLVAYGLVEIHGS